jgi:ABC-type Mn2+/Zn2+ transport system ATPase subunit
VRSAVLSSALRFFTKEGTHLRLMLSDEAFSKMDESRRRSVIRYLRQALGVQFIVAMPTSNSGSVKPEFDKEFTFAQVPALLADGREWMASEAQEKDLKPDAMKVMWEAARTEAAARAREEFLEKNPEARAELETK